MYGPPSYVNDQNYTWEKNSDMCHNDTTFRDSNFLNSNVISDYDQTQEKWKLEDLDQGELLYK